MIVSIGGVRYCSRTFMFGSKRLSCERPDGHGGPCVHNPRDRINHLGLYVQATVSNPEAIVPVTIENIEKYGIIIEVGP